MEDRKGGFPHSEITGSKGARASPALIAACHVLHRLSTPRHPLGALIRLIVLSKTHACFAVRSTQGQGDPIRKRTHQFCISQTMMSSQVQPGQCLRIRLNPSIHDVKARPAEAGVQFCHLYREVSSAPLSGRWWSQTGSNRRPDACKAPALPTELWPHKSEAHVGDPSGSYRHG